MKFELGADELIFENGADYSASRPLEKVQAIDRAATGKPEVEKLGPSISTRVLVFNEMSETDYLAFRNWFDNIADGAVNSFYFTDEKGDSGTVKITSNIYNFRETSYQLYAGSIVLEYV